MAARTRADMALALVEKHRAEAYLQSGFLLVSFRLGSMAYACRLDSQRFADALIGWMDAEYGLTLPKSAIQQVLATLATRARRASELAKRHLTERFRDVAVGGEISVKQMVGQVPGVGHCALIAAAHDLSIDPDARIMLELEERGGAYYLVRRPIELDEGFDAKGGVFLVPGAGTGTASPARGSGTASPARGSGTGT